MNSKLSAPILIKSEKEAQALKSKKASLLFIDAFPRQLKELFLIKNPALARKDKKKVFASSAFKKFFEKGKENFHYFYYPWQNTLVKCVKRPDFFLLKTNRNQDLITSFEQKKFARYKVAVLGLSVGGSIAWALAQAGISNQMILADFDELETTNLNRVVAGLPQIGLNKAVLIARKISEANPYAKLKVLSQGITGQSLEKLLAAKKIDCLVEEIDDLALKIKVRGLARKYCVPVVMITDNGDGVILDVERYDLGYKKIFGKADSFWQKKAKNFKNPSEALKIIISNIVGGQDKVDPRMLVSVQKVVGKKLVSWPQLGSAALLAGVIATIVIKKIIRGENKKLFWKEHINPLD
jgi:molybdopterin/thiamine biosynthesis adenylyltransferase